MARALFDTNILIDWSKGYPEALAELMLWEHPAISVVTWVEFYGGARDDDIHVFDEFLSGRGFEIIEIDSQIMEIAAAVVSAKRRFGTKIQLADAIIEATARVRGFTIVTRNTKDFKGKHVRVPYELRTITTTTVTVINVRPPVDNAD